MGIDTQPDFKVVFLDYDAEFLPIQRVITVTERTCLSRLKAAGVILIYYSKTQDKQTMEHELSMTGLEYDFVLDWSYFEKRERYVYNNT